MARTHGEDFSVFVLTIETTRVDLLTSPSRWLDLGKFPWEMDIGLPASLRSADESILTGSVLSYPIPTGKFILDMDASKVGLCSVNDTGWSCYGNRLFQQDILEVVEELLIEQKRIVGEPWSTFTSMCTEGNSCRGRTMHPWSRHTDSKVREIRKPDRLRDCGNSILISNIVLATLMETRMHSRGHHERTTMLTVT